jgi:pimeloyl-ACP methyl ester carboxylesterase
MPRIDANGIQLEYDVAGDPNGPPVLLVMGLGAQLTRWPEDFHRGLCDAGFRVVRYDNRDVGLSSRVEARIDARIEAGKAPRLPRVVSTALRAAVGLRVDVPYLLSDLAADAVGLLDALGLASAHVVGVSMGGMIGQIMAAQHAARVRAFVSIMSSSGSRRLPPPRLSLAVGLLRRRRARGRDEAIADTFAMLKQISSPGFPADDERLRASIARDVDRAYDPRGMRRQLLAIVASGSRTSILGRITAPTLILHGAADPLVPVAAAYDLHRRIAGSRMEVFPGMGHDLPRALIPVVTERIVEHLRRAERAHRGVASAS